MRTLLEITKNIRIENSAFKHPAALSVAIFMTPSVCDANVGNLQQVRGGIFSQYNNNKVARATN